MKRIPSSNLTKKIKKTDQLSETEIWSLGMTINVKFL